MDNKLKSNKYDMINKNILIFDLETTGLPICKSGYYDKRQYYNYTDNSKYDTSRIVSIAWSYIENYTHNKLDKIIENDDIEYHIRKPTDFNKIENSDFHGITYKIAKEKGIILSKILNDGFGYAITNCDYIVGHNCLFDIFILLNELYRIKFNTCLEKLENILNNDNYICTGEYSRDICKMKTRNKFIYKMPKLCELYEYYYNSKPEKQHEAKADVKTVILIMIMMF